MKTIFYIEPENSILAVFPDQPYKPNFDATVMCYAQIGQHSGLCPEYLKECRIAKQEEYKPLELELRGLGYELDILNLLLENPLNP